MLNYTFQHSTAQFATCKGGVLWEIRSTNCQRIVRALQIQRGSTMKPVM